MYRQMSFCEKKKLWCIENERWIIAFVLVKWKNKGKKVWNNWHNLQNKRKK